MKKIEWPFLVNVVLFLNLTMMLAEEGESNSAATPHGILEKGVLFYFSNGLKLLTDNTQHVGFN